MRIQTRTRSYFETKYQNKYLYKVFECHFIYHISIWSNGILLFPLGSKTISVKTIKDVTFLSYLQMSMHRQEAILYTSFVVYTLFTKKCNKSWSRRAMLTWASDTAGSTLPSASSPWTCPLPRALQHPLTLPRWSAHPVCQTLDPHNFPLSALWTEEELFRMHALILVVFKWCFPV